MSEKFNFEHEVPKRYGEENPDFQGDYTPEEVSLEDLREKMKRLAQKEKAG